MDTMDLSNILSCNSICCKDTYFAEQTSMLYIDASGQCSPYIPTQKCKMSQIMSQIKKIYNKNCLNYLVIQSAICVIHVTTIPTVIESYDWTQSMDNQTFITVQEKLLNEAAEAIVFGAL